MIASSGTSTSLFELKTGTFFKKKKKKKKKGHPKFNHPLFNPFVSVLHQNKILHSQKGEASDFWMHNMFRLGPAMRPIDWRNEVPRPISNMY